MKINYKQQELIEEFFNLVKSKYPEIEFEGLQESPNDPGYIWICVVTDMDEEREMEMREFAVHHAIEIFDKYGYLFSIMVTNQNLIAA